MVTPKGWVDAQQQRKDHLLREYRRMMSISVEMQKKMTPDQKSRFSERLCYVRRQLQNLGYFRAD